MPTFTGSELEHQPPTWTARQGFLVGLKRLTQQYTVYLTSRKQNLPRGYSAKDMSNDFAAMIRADIGGRVHIMGMSSGGSSAMHFAVDHADLVNKLVLAMTIRVAFPATSSRVAGSQPTLLSTGAGCSPTRAALWSCRRCTSRLPSRANSHGCRLRARGRFFRSGPSRLTWL